MSYQFDIESDGESDDGTYNSRTVVLGGGRVNYIKTSPPVKQQVKAKAEAEVVLVEEYTYTRAPERIRPASLPLDKKTVTVLPSPRSDEKIPYEFKKIPWQLPKIVTPPIDVAPVQKVEGTLINEQSTKQEYTVVKTRPPAMYNRLSGQTPDKKNTRLCQFVKFDINPDKSATIVYNRCKNAACNFAHTMEIYTPPTCTYQEACKNGQECRFFHTHTESKIDYYIRSLTFKPLEPRKPFVVLK